MINTNLWPVISWLKLGYWYCHFPLAGFKVLFLHLVAGTAIFHWPVLKCYSFTWYGCFLHLPMAKFSQTQIHCKHAQATNSFKGVMPGPTFLPNRQTNTLE